MTKSKTILMIDHRKILLSLWKRVFQQKNFILTTETEVATLNRLDKITVDIVFVGSLIPPFSRATRKTDYVSNLIKRIRKKHPNVTIITKLGSKQFYKKARDAGADYFIRRNKLENIRRAFVFAGANNK